MVSCVNVELFGRLPVKVPSAARSAPMEAAAGWAIGSQSHGRSRQSRAKNEDTLVAGIDQKPGSCSHQIADK